MTIHFSIDDVVKAFRYLTKNCPASIFDVRLFGKLREWHREFGLIVSLYCFNEIDDFTLSQIPEKYMEDFRASCDWLKIGFHGKCGNYPFKHEVDYITGFESVEQAISQLGAGKTNILRLHSWQATQSQKKFLFEKGIKILLYPNEGIEYDNNDAFYDGIITHWRTRVWFEKIELINEKSLCIGMERIVAFTHERCFEYEAQKIEKALKIWKGEGYGWHLSFH
ncbi:MAG: hypothetical protein LBC87_09330 [Fibromonadaceae bacterium]|jgi:hypothetical protein|nr:hypothetical protein [Fibromonadaceae bacterium]